MATVSNVICRDSHAGPICDISLIIHDWLCECFVSTLAFSFTFSTILTIFNGLGQLNNTLQHLHLVTIMDLRLVCVFQTLQVPEVEQELFTNNFIYGSKLLSNTEINESRQQTTEDYTEISCKSTILQSTNSIY